MPYNGDSMFIRNIDTNLRQSTRCYKTVTACLSERLTLTYTNLQDAIKRWQYVYPKGWHQPTPIYKMPYNGDSMFIR
jgi:hypothetical protein